MELKQLKQTVNTTKLKEVQKIKIIKAIEQTKYKGTRCKIVGYQFALNTTPKRLCDYLIKLEMQRAKVRDDEPKIIDLD